MSLCKCLFYCFHYGILSKIDIFLCKTTNLSIYKKKNKLLGIFLISARLIDVKKMLSDRQEPESEKTKNYSELYTAVNSLKEELRLPVILYYIEDFSVKEIAQILEISEGAVQKRLARARGKLRQELQEVSI